MNTENKQLFIGFIYFIVAVLFIIVGVSKKSMLLSIIGVLLSYGINQYYYYIGYQVGWKLQKEKLNKEYYEK